MFAGMDFGAKSRRSTAITFAKKQQLYTYLCPEKKDVDEWIVAFLLANGITTVFIDAPLSLPRIYFDPTHKKSTYHFRQADQELKAMSPLFLGGLTARAISLKMRLEKQVTFYETYPKAVLKKRFVNDAKEDALQFISSHTKCLLPDHVLNAHEQDSILAWYAAYCYFSQDSMVFGAEEEGYIFV